MELAWHARQAWFPTCTERSFIPSPYSMSPLLHSFIALLPALLLVSAYIPASPTNDTDLAIQNGLNVSDQSRVILRWYSPVG
jgi:hypothetical protein